MIARVDNSLSFTEEAMYAPLAFAWPESVTITMRSGGANFQRTVLPLTHPLKNARHHCRALSSCS